MFAAQGGDTRVLDDYSLFEKPAASYELLAEEDGYIVANGRREDSALPAFCWAQAVRRRATRWTSPPASSSTRSAATTSARARASPPSTARRISSTLPPPSTAAASSHGSEKPEEAPLVYALVTKDGVEPVLKYLNR